MRVVILGAGFGGLECATCLSEALGEQASVTLIDQSDSFVLGFSKLDVMFGRAAPEAIHLPYRAIARPGVVFRRETVTAIDPVAKRVVTGRATYDADVLVVALGADYDVAATPGLAEGGHEFYSVEAAKRLRAVLPAFKGGTVVVGVMTPHFKCPPAPSETAMLMHTFLAARGLRARSRIVLVTPQVSPLPVTKAAGDAILARFDELGIECLANAATARVDGAARTLHLATGQELRYDLLLAVPVHVAPKVVLESGLAHDGWIPVAKPTLETRFPDVYAIGDVTSVGTPRAGVFAEGAGKVVAAQIAARAKGGEAARYLGDGLCYIEYGEEQVAEVAVDFFSGAKPTADLRTPTAETAAGKRRFGASRRARWFGM